MTYRIAADALLVFHLLFIAFAAIGALLAWRWPPLLWLQIPAACWAFWIEITGGLCPLTQWENAWRIAAGQTGYAGGFIEHYLLRLIYPEGLTRGLQWALGMAVLVVNLGMYAALARHAVRARESNQPKGLGKQP
jgi:Protein of Unknown function (DUF2784)